MICHASSNWIFGFTFELVGINKPIKLGETDGLPNQSTISLTSNKSMRIVEISVGHTTNEFYKIAMKFSDEPV